MSTETNKAIVRRHLIEGITKGNMAVFDEVLAPNYTDYGVIPGLPSPLPNREVFKQVIGAFHAAFPGFQLLPEGELIAEGDRVAVRFTFEGTHQGELMGIPATGKQVQMTGIALYRFEGSKIVQATVEENIYGMMQQLGVIPIPGQAD